jgi:hypothetical protein
MCYLCLDCAGACRGYVLEYTLYIKIRDVLVPRKGIVSNQRPAIGSFPSWARWSGIALNNKHVEWMCLGAAGGDVVRCSFFWMCFCGFFCGPFCAVAVLAFCAFWAVSVPRSGFCVCAFLCFHFFLMPGDLTVHRPTTAQIKAQPSVSVIPHAPLLDAAAAPSALPSCTKLFFLVALTSRLQVPYGRSTRTRILVLGATTPLLVALRR